MCMNGTLTPDRGERLLAMVLDGLRAPSAAQTLKGPRSRGCPVSRHWRASQPQSVLRQITLAQ